MRGGPDDKTVMLPLLHTALGLLAPPRCLGCDFPFTLLPIGPSERFCGACHPLLEPLPEERSWALPEVGLFRYCGPLQDAIRRMKFGQRSDVAAGLAAFFAEQLPTAMPHHDSMISIPLHRTTARRRGFNPSAIFARKISQRTGTPFRPELLRKVRCTPPQSSLGRTDRANNVSQAFQAERADGAILLVDDVRTTGATGNAARHALTKAGADCVQLVTLAVSIKDGL